MEGRVGRAVGLWGGYIVMILITAGFLAWVSLPNTPKDLDESLQQIVIVTNSGKKLNSVFDGLIARPIGLLSLRQMSLQGTRNPRGCGNSGPVAGGTEIGVKPRAFFSQLLAFFKIPVVYAQVSCNQDEQGYDICSGHYMRIQQNPCFEGCTNDFAQADAENSTYERGYKDCIKTDAFCQGCDGDRICINLN